MIKLHFNQCGVIHYNALIETLIAITFLFLRSSKKWVYNSEQTWHATTTFSCVFALQMTILNCCLRYMNLGRWGEQHTNTFTLTSPPPPSECSITLETEAWFICSQIKATEVERVEKIIPSKQEKNFKLSINNMKRVLVMKAVSRLIGTHRSLVCCKPSYYITLTWAQQCVQAHSVYILDCELVAQCGSGFIHQDYSTVNEEWNQNLWSA